MAEYDVLFLLFLNMHVALLCVAFSAMATFFTAWFILGCFVWCLCGHAAFTAGLAFLAFGHIMFSSIFFNSHSDNEQPNPGSFLEGRLHANVWAEGAGVTFVTAAMLVLMQRFSALSDFSLLFGDRDFQVVSAHTLRESLRNGDNFILVLLIMLVLVTALGSLRILRRRFFEQRGGQE